MAKGRPKRILPGEIDTEYLVEKVQEASNKIQAADITPAEVEQAKETIKAYEERQKIKTICIIPARAGSKRLPGKNFKELDGKTVLEHAVNIACFSLLFDDVIISTDDKDIQQLAGDVTMHKRSEKNSSDTAGLREVVLEVLEDEKYKDVESICILYTTGVFTKKEDLEKGLKMLGDHNTVFPVKPLSIDLKNILYIKSQQVYALFPTFDSAKIREIVASGLKEHVGQWFVVRRSWVDAHRIIEGNCGYVEVDWMDGEDVNTEENWFVMEAKYKEAVK